MPRGIPIALALILAGYAKTAQINIMIGTNPVQPVPMSTEKSLDETLTPETAAPQPSRFKKKPVALAVNAKITAKKSASTSLE